MPICKMLDAIKVNASLEMLGAVSPSSKEKMREKDNAEMKHDYERTVGEAIKGIQELGERSIFERDGHKSVDGTEWHREAEEEIVRAQEENDQIEALRVEVANQIGKGKEQEEAALKVGRARSNEERNTRLTRETKEEFWDESRERELRERGIIGPDPNVSMGRKSSGLFSDSS